MATDPRVHVGTPQLLFARPLFAPAAGWGAPNYDVAHEGQRFVMVDWLATQGGTKAPRIHVVLNWFQELTARVPVP